MTYMATREYYDEAGNEIVTLCGFGRVRDLDEAKKTYNRQVQIVEITEAEFRLLQEQHEKEWHSEFRRTN